MAIVLGKAKGKYYWRVYVDDQVEWKQGEQLFMSTVSAVDALGFALRENFPREYCAALAESVLDSLIDG